MSKLQRGRTGNGPGTVLVPALLSLGRMQDEDVPAPFIAAQRFAAVGGQA
jgi:hypothetical protein